MKGTRRSSSVSRHDIPCFEPDLFVVDIWSERGILWTGLRRANPSRMIDGRPESATSEMGTVTKNTYGDLLQALIVWYVP